MKTHARRAARPLVPAFVVAAVIITALVVGGAAAAPAVNGTYRTLNGIRVLHLWGTPYEMGYAHGYLLGDEITSLFREVYLPLIDGADGLTGVMDTYNTYFTAPDWELDETRGIVDGLRDAGADLFMPDLGRDLLPDDFLAMDALSDVRTTFLCASFSAWDDATADDALLAGESALARNLDWWTPFGHPYELAANSLVIGREPDGRRATLMVGFSGLSGCYSCMNDAGVATTRMMSNHSVPPWDMDTTHSFVPLNLTMRDALESDDPDGDGVFTVDDETKVVSESARSSSYNIMVVGKMSDGRDPVVIEINNQEVVFRRDSDQTDLPTHVLGATNHMRKMYPPVPDERYAAMRSDVNGWDGVLNMDRIWQVLGAMYDVWLTGETTQSMVFVPFNRSLALSYTDENDLAPFKEPVWLSWDDVFGDRPPADDDDDTWGGDDDATDDDTGDDDSGDNDAADDDFTAPLDGASDDDDDDGGGCCG